MPSRDLTSEPAGTIKTSFICGRKSFNALNASEDSPNSTPANDDPVRCKNHPLRPAENTGASAATAPGTSAQLKASRSGVLNGESCSTEAVDNRPLFTIRRANTQSFASRKAASRNTRETSLFGVMKSVERV